MPKQAANLSMLFGDVEILDRFNVAARIGFRGRFHPRTGIR